MLTLQFVPYSEINHLTSIGKIRKLLNLAKENKIVLLEGRLQKEEETELIKTTMEEINKDFKGIELAVLSSKQDNSPFFNVIKDKIAKVLIGERDAITIIGPASIVHEIKKDPTKIEMMLKKK